MWENIDFATAMKSDFVDDKRGHVNAKEIRIRYSICNSEDLLAPHSKALTLPGIAVIQLKIHEVSKLGNVVAPSGRN